MSPTITPTPSITAKVTPRLTATPTPTFTPVQLEKNSVISYPSPAWGAEVWFLYNLESAGHLDILIYNASGEKVGTLEADAPQGGYGRLKWDLGNVAPGVYLYRVRWTGPAGKTAWLGEVRKLAVVKSLRAH